MSSPQTDEPPGSQQVNDLLSSVEIARAVSTEDFRRLLENIPIPIVVSKVIGGDQRVVYANKAFESLAGQTEADLLGRGWWLLAEYRDESEPGTTLHQAVLRASEDFLGRFKRDEPRLVVEAYVGVIENEDGNEEYRIVALIDVTERAQAERDQFIRQLRDKDLLLKELQHRVRNNLQLITALIRLDARTRQRSDVANLDKLAGRIESLQFLYHGLSADGLGKSVDLGHYLSQIASAVMHTFAVDGISLDLKVDYALVSVNLAMPVGLLVNELLTNAFKYAFAGRGGGTLTLRCLHPEGGNYRVVVADDGVGLPDGLSWPVPGKLGALILQSLRENAETDFRIDSAPGKGTRVTIEFAQPTLSPKAS